MKLFGSPNIDKLEAKKNVQALLKIIADKKAGEVRIPAAEALGRIGDEAVVNPLIKLFWDRDSQLRKAAINAVARIGAPAVVSLIENLERSWIQDEVIECLVLIGPPAIPPLVEALEKKAGQYTQKVLIKIGEPAVEPLLAAIHQGLRRNQSRAIYILGAIGDKRAVQPLINKLANPSADIRKQSAESLGMLGDPAAIPSLIGALADSHSGVRAAAANALRQLKWTPDQEAASAFYWAARKDQPQCVRLGELAIMPMVKLLSDDDYDTARFAMEVLGNIGDARGVDPLLSVCQRGNESLLKAAKDALKKIGGKSINDLVGALASEDVNIRQFAIEVLGEIRDPRAIQFLAARFKSDQKDEVQAVSEALVKIGAPAIETFIDVLVNEARWIREYAVSGLEQLRWQPDNSIAGASYWILKGQYPQCVSIGAPAVKPLIAEFNNEFSNPRDAAADALVQIGAAAVEPLIQAIHLEDQGWSKLVILTLGKIQDSRAVEPLINVLKDPSFSLVGEAASALGQIGDSRALHPLLEALDNPNKPSKPTVILALGLLGDSGAVEALTAKLEIRDNDEKPDLEILKATATALGNIGDPRAIEPLRSLLLEGDFGIRKVATEALDRIGWKPDDSKAGVFYWIAKEEYEKCLELGPQAVEAINQALEDDSYHHQIQWHLIEILEQIGDPNAIPGLIYALKNEAYVVRIEAAKALIAFYRSGTIDESQRQSILAQRPVIEQRHIDESGSSDCSWHGDSGIGMLFNI